MSNIFHDPDYQEEMTPEEARAWVMVYHPTMSLKAQELLVVKLSKKERYHENHALALEACLLSFESCIDQLGKVETAIDKMRLKTRKKVGNKFTPRKKVVARKGKNHREAYWNANAKPIMEIMEVRLDTLQTQLHETSGLFSDLAQKANLQMMLIMDKRAPVKAVSYGTKVHPIVETWKALTAKLHDLMQQGENVLPAIQNEIKQMHLQLRTAIAAT
jgi:hypothetical protein